MVPTIQGNISWCITDRLCHFNASYLVGPLLSCTFSIVPLIHQLQWKSTLVKILIYSMLSAFLQCKFLHKQTSTSDFTSIFPQSWLAQSHCYLFTFHFSVGFGPIVLTEIFRSIRITVLSGKIGFSSMTTWNRRKILASLEWSLPSLQNTCQPWNSGENISGLFNLIQWLSLPSTLFSCMYMYMYSPSNCNITMCFVILYVNS